MIPIIVTAALIATDALFVGMSLGMQKGFRQRVLLFLNSIIFAMCMVVYLVAALLKGYIQFDTSLVVGIVFIVLGCFTAFSKPGKTHQPASLKSVVALGLVMSIDATMGTAALTIEHSQTVFIPVLIGVTHLIYSFIGSCLGRRIKLAGWASRLIPGFCLMAVGVMNIIGL